MGRPSRLALPMSTREPPAYRERPAPLNPATATRWLPAISIVKYTNGQIANDPNGTDVPVIKPGDPVTWTYEVTNTGQVAIARSNVSVTDDQTGVTPAFDHEKTGNGDAIFDPGEVWVYVATGGGGRPVHSAGRRDGRPGRMHPRPDPAASHRLCQPGNRQHTGSDQHS